MYAAQDATATMSPSPTPLSRPLVLRRRELLTTAAATARGCLLVYPPTRKGRQRFGVGDCTGVFAVYGTASSKARDCTRVFCTPATATATTTTAAGDVATATDKVTPIACATLYRDQLFVMRGSAVDAYTRKGTHFFHVDTSVTDSAHALVIDTPFIFVAGEYILTALRETHELGFYLCPDRIHAMVAFAHYGNSNNNNSSSSSSKASTTGAVVGGGDADSDTEAAAAATAAAPHTLDDYYCVCACHDCVLRVVRGCKLLCEVPCEAVVTALCYDATTRRVYYGTQGGAVGAYAITVATRTQDGNGSDGMSGGGDVLRVCARQRSHHTAPSSPSSSSAPAAANEAAGSVTCVSLCDVDGDGECEVLAGCGSGSVAVYRHVRQQEATPSPSSSSSVLHHLVCVWRVSVGERVMSVAGGVVVSSSSAGTADVLVHVYSGRVLAFALDKAATAAAAAAEAEAAAAAATTTTTMTSAVAVSVAVDDKDVLLPPHGGVAAHEEDKEAAHTQQQLQLQHEQEQHVQLAHDVAQLRERVAAAMRELAMSTASPHATARRHSVAAVTSSFHATVTLAPVEDGGAQDSGGDGDNSSNSCYGSALLALCVDADVPLECVVLRSALPLTFVGTAHTHVAMQGSTHASQPRTRALALATPLVHEQHDNSNTTNRRSGNGGGGGSGEDKDVDDVMLASSRRFEVHVRCYSSSSSSPDAARSDVLTLTLYSAAAPRTAQVHTVLFCALPLHTRVAATAATTLLSAHEAALVLSQLRITSDGLTWADVHDWLSQLLPGVASLSAHALRTQPRLYYRCAYTATVLVVEVQASDAHDGGSSSGHAVSSLTFYSDCLTTLQTVHRCVTAAAAATSAHRRLSLQVHVSARYGSAARQLQLMQPQLERCVRDGAVALLASAMRELDVYAGDAAACMPHELRAYAARAAAAAAAATTAAKGVYDGSSSGADDSMSHTQRLTQLQQVLCDLYDSLTALVAHTMAGAAGTLSVDHHNSNNSSTTAAAHAALRRLTSARVLDMAALLRVYFPRDEHVHERRQLQQSMAAAAANEDNNNAAVDGDSSVLVVDGDKDVRADGV